MSFTHRITLGWAQGTNQISRAKDYTFGAAPDISEEIPAPSTDLLINWTLDFSTLKSLYMVCDRDITIETNNGTTPGNTINLVAGVPLVWTHDGYHANPFTVDVTALYVTLAAGANATLEIRCTADATP